MAICFTAGHNGQRRTGFFPGTFTGFDNDQVFFKRHCGANPNGSTKKGRYSPQSTQSVEDYIFSFVSFVSFVVQNTLVCKKEKRSRVVSA
jgi:hypothetical protein